MGFRVFFPSRRSAWLVVFGCLLFLLTALPLLSGCSLDMGCAGKSATTALSTGTPTSMVVVVATSSTSSTSTTEATTTTSTEPPFVQQEGEIFLDAAGAEGPDSFTGETFLPAGPTSTLNIPTTTIPASLTTTTAGTGATTTVPGTVQLVSYKGDTPALYGGSKSKKLADKEGQLEFFTQHPEKAAAFCAALDSDPTFKWSGGTQIEPGQLRDYFDELTPVMLVKDTRVTNYGYRDGRPTPRQSVLQKGQLVLVDLYGVPRARCECGNPLTPPKAVRTTPRYTGPQWTDFDPAVIIVIQPTVVVIKDLVLIDISTGQPFDRPVGTNGTQDVAHMGGAYHLDVEMTWQDDPNKRLSTIKWSGDLTVGPDGTLKGSGKGTLHIDGTAFRQDTFAVVGNWVGDASFDVAVSGKAGVVLAITPTMGGFKIGKMSYHAPGFEKGMSASLKEIIPSVAKTAFVELDLKPDQLGPVKASVTAGDFQGSATLTPIVY